MINPKDLFEELKRNGVDFFTGVPDSLLKDFCAYITENTTPKNHIIAANEGGAIALATGYHLVTGKVPLVYFQNSGLGNATNPLLSLASEGVYNIPIILMIGWRGEPGIKDEPQHLVQGAVQNDLLSAMHIPVHILDKTVTDITRFVSDILKETLAGNKPVAIIVRKDTFSPFKLQDEKSQLEMSREDALHEVLSLIDPDSVVVSTTGKLSREVYEYRYYNHQSTQEDFLTVGSMGHASQIALGIALNTNKTVFCLDGDGAVLMHMGAMAINGNSAAGNFIHILFNNGSHESVGGQPTVGFNINFPKIASACAYRTTFRVTKKTEIPGIFEKIKNLTGPVFIEIMVKKGSKPDLMRPKDSPVVNKIGFMKKLQS